MIFVSQLQLCQVTKKMSLSFSWKKKWEQFRCVSVSWPRIGQDSARLLLLLIIEALTANSSRREGTMWACHLHLHHQLHFRGFPPGNKHMCAHTELRSSHENTFKPGIKLGQARWLWLKEKGKHCQRDPQNVFNLCFYKQHWHQISICVFPTELLMPEPFLTISIVSVCPLIQVGWFTILFRKYLDNFCMKCQNPLAGNFATDYN